MVKHEDVHRITVTLTIGSEQALFILLDAGGGINRLGTGSESNTEQDMFIGQTDPSLFRHLRDQITPGLLRWCGQMRADPQPVGKLCELTVGFYMADGQELITAWKYGSESPGPPPEVGQFVIAAVEVTNPWFEQQQAMAHM